MVMIQTKEIKKYVKNIHAMIEHRQDLQANMVTVLSSITE